MVAQSVRVVVRRQKCERSWVWISAASKDVKIRVVIAPSPSAWYLEMKITGLSETEIPCHGRCWRVSAAKVLGIGPNSQSLTGNDGISV
jgi:hypothetical protein